jgi:pimeloyl-ACP methyl ester carboxylesterase
MQIFSTGGIKMKNLIKNGGTTDRVRLPVAFTALFFCLLTACNVTGGVENGNNAYRITKMHCKNNGKKIFGIAYIPVNAGAKMPTVIFAHGYLGTNSAGKVYADALAKKGIAVYCFDFCGGSPISKSDGKTTDMSVFTEKSDLEAVITMIRSRDFVDSDNLFLMGESQGGMVSAMTAADQPASIRGLILIYPAFVIAGSGEEKYKSIDKIPRRILFMWMWIGRRYYEDIWGYDVYNHIGAYDRNVLIIHGDSDTLVPLSSSEKAMEIYPSAGLKIMSGSGHGFSDEEKQKVIEYILEYITKTRL